jgi:hypothetical protein
MHRMQTATRMRACNGRWHAEKFHLAQSAAPPDTVTGHCGSTCLFNKQGWVLVAMKHSTL